MGSLMSPWQIEFNTHGFLRMDVTSHLTASHSLGFAFDVPVIILLSEIHTSKTNQQ
jgi:hypothetical protein